MHPHPPTAGALLDVRRLLRPRELAAADEVVRRVREEVPAELALALLFGSRARGQARPGSDVDVLLVFRRLPWDREPQAGLAEEAAARVAEAYGVPVAPWSVSLPDLERGRRTPMLVDALEDGVALWPRGAPAPRVAFTPDDACFCAGELLERVREGSDEVAARLSAGDREGAVRRARDDVARLCTAALLLRGETRPRRGAAVARAAERLRGGQVRPGVDAGVLAWAAASYGPTGRDESPAVGMPPGGLAGAARAIDRLGALVADERRRLARGIRPW